MSQGSDMRAFAFTTLTAVDSETLHLRGRSLVAIVDWSPKAMKVVNGVPVYIESGIVTVEFKRDQINPPDPMAGDVFTTQNNKLLTVSEVHSTPLTWFLFCTTANDQN